MTLAKGVLPPKDDEEMFIGWAKAPAVDRRFLLGAIPLALAGAGGLAFALARALEPPGAGAWRTGAIHRETGVLALDPYPILRVPDAAAPFGMRSVLIVAVGKCTSGLKLGGAAGSAFTASGVLIERGSRRMLEVPFDLGAWLEPASLADAGRLAAPPAQSLGRARLAGTIMDSKCFFGVMRPGRGKTHKACAAICIRSGIPPSFWVRTKSGRESVLLMTDAGGAALGEDILPLVADPVEAEGEIVRIGDLLTFRADAGAFRRL